MLQSAVLASAVFPPPPGGGGTTTYDVYGYVKRQGTSDPIASAMVKIYVDNVWKATDYTDANGYFSKSVTGRSSTENFKVLVVKYPWTDKIKYGIPDQYDNVNFGNVYMTRMYTIYGETNPDATVTIYRDVYEGWSEIGQTTPDAYGDFSFEYTTGDSMTQCKAIATVGGFANPGASTVSVTSNSVNMGELIPTHSYNPDISASISSIDEKQAQLDWTVNDWGNLGQGTDCYASVSWKGVNDADWEMTEIIDMDGEDEGSQVLTGLVMDTEYAWSITVGHTVQGEERSQTNEDTFTTDDWTCTSKYAIIIDLTFLTADSEYNGHKASRDNIFNFIEDGDGLHWFFDDCHNPVPVETHDDWQGDRTTALVNHISHFNQVTDSGSLLFIYIVGHGEQNVVKVGGRVSSGGTDVSISVVAQALNSYDGDNKPGKMIIYFENCYSGSYIDDVSAEDRLVITAADSYHESVVDFGQGLFTLFFEDGLRSQYSIYNVFEYAYTELETYYDEHEGEVPGNLPFQNPLLNDLWSGLGAGYEEMRIALEVLGKRVNQCGALAYVLSLRIINN
ncbi:MAG: C13 family peptidase [Candidatus Thorarchaeota archaeon]